MSLDRNTTDNRTSALATRRDLLNRLKTTWTFFHKRLNLLKIWPALLPTLCKFLHSNSYMYIHQFSLNSNSFKSWKINSILIINQPITGGSRVRVWRPHGERGGARYNGSLGAEPQRSSGPEPLVRRSRAELAPWSRKHFSSADQPASSAIHILCTVWFSLKKTKTKMPKQQNLSLNESASIQYGAYRCYGRTALNRVTNGGRYLARSLTRLRQQVWYYLVVGKTKTKTTTKK